MIIDTKWIVVLDERITILWLLPHIGKEATTFTIWNIAGIIIVVNNSTLLVADSSYA